MNPSCTLDPAQRRRRVEDILALARDGLTGATLRFEPELRPRLEALVAAESECCAFLEPQLTEDADSVVLTIGAPGLAGLFSGIQAPWPSCCSSP